MIYTFTRNFNCNTISIRFFAGLLSWNRCKNALKYRTKADKLHTHGPNIVWIKKHFGMYIVYTRKNKIHLPKTWDLCVSFNDSNSV